MPLREKFLYSMPVHEHVRMNIYTKHCEEISLLVAESIGNDIIHLWVHQYPNTVAKFTDCFGEKWWIRTDEIIHIKLTNPYDDIPPSWDLVCRRND